MRTTPELYYSLNLKVFNYAKKVLMLPKKHMVSISTSEHFTLHPQQLCSYPNKSLKIPILTLIKFTPTHPSTQLHPFFSNSSETSCVATITALVFMNKSGNHKNHTRQRSLWGKEDFIPINNSVDCSQ